MRLLKRRRPHRRSGIVLLLVLVSLVIAATALVSVARQSYRLGIDAVRARRQLQQKWGAESLRRAYLPVASTVFKERDKASRKLKVFFPPPELPGSVLLGDVQFQFVLADEDARANVNSIYHYSDSQTASAVVRDLSQAIGGVRLNAECKPVGGLLMIEPLGGEPLPDRGGSQASDDEGEDALGADVAPIAFRAWGQVFELSRVPNLQRATRRLSCWGTEALNVRRADEETVVEVAGIVIGKAAARRMLNDYRKNRGNEINRTIDRYSSKAKERLQLKRLLSESSMCYSIWVRSVRKTDMRDSFAVLAPDKDGAFRTTEIEYRGRQ